MVVESHHQARRPVIPRQKQVSPARAILGRCTRARPTGARMLQQTHRIRKADPPDPIAAAVAENDKRWQQRLERYADHLRQSWESFEKTVAILDDELDGEISEDEWGDLSAGFKHL